MKYYITEDEAYKLYLDSGYENIFPFKNVLIPEFTFIDYLQSIGYIIIDDEEQE